VVMAPGLERARGLAVNMFLFWGILFQVTGSVHQGDWEVKKGSAKTIPLIGLQG